MQRTWRERLSPSPRFRRLCLMLSIKGLFSPFVSAVLIMSSTSSWEWSWPSVRRTRPNSSLEIRPSWFLSNRSKACFMSEKRKGYTNQKCETKPRNFTQCFNLRLRRSKDELRILSATFPPTRCDEVDQ